MAMQSTNKILIALVAVAVLVGVSTLVTSEKVKVPFAKERSAIQLGLIAPLTGTAAIYGEEARNAVILGIEQINATGGIGGRKLELIVQDGKCEARASLDAWETLVHGQKVTIVFGGHCSTETVSLAPRAANDHVLMLANVTSASVIPNEGTWVFRNSPPNSYYAQEGAKYVAAQGIKRIITITELKDYPVDYTDNFVAAFKAAGGEVVAQEKFPPDAKDFRTILNKIKVQLHDTLLISTQGPATMGIIADQMRTLRYEPMTMFNLAFNAQKFLESSRGYIPPKHIVVSPYTNPDPAFVDTYRARFGTDIKFNPYMIAATYDMVYRLKAALDACNANERDLPCLQRSFQATKEWHGAAGTITFEPDHRPHSPLAVLRVVNGVEQYEPLK